MVTKYFFIPKNYQTSIVKNTSFILWLKNSLFTIALPLKNFIKINSHVNIVLSLCSYTRNINNFLFATSNLNLDVVKFKGKGFKLSQKKNVLDFLFNFAHINYLIFKKSLVKKISKNKIILLHPSNNYLIKIKTTVVNIRASNYYTYNGLRLKRQIIYKRKGKTLAS